MKLYYLILTVLIIPAVPIYAQGHGAFDFSPAQYDPGEYTEAMHISRGGQLYDDWWRVKVDAEKPETDHPLWKKQSGNKRGGYTTYRCKECHGWDYKGKDGAYGAGSHYTGFAGVYETSMKLTKAELEGVLKGLTDSDHDFSAYLNDDDISDLALFMKNGVIDTVKLINGGGGPIGGSMEAGRDIYSRNCMAECHGPDGTAINSGSAEEPEFIGTAAGENPWEFIHKVRAGQPGTRMSSGIINNMTDQDLRDLLSYAQTLPKELPEPGWFDRIKEYFGLSMKRKPGHIPEEHRGFGPKIEQ